LIQFRDKMFEIFEAHGISPGYQ